MRAENYNLHKRVKRLKNKSHELHSLRRSLLKLGPRNNDLEQKMADLPEVQREVVRHIFAFSSILPKQRRYSIEYIDEYLCFYLKSKLPNEYVREREILTLPCRKTICKYVENIDTNYGFQKKVLDCLKFKGSRMLPQIIIQLRGIF